MALPLAKNSLALLRQFQSKMQSRTGITSFAENSKARALIEIFQDEEVAAREEIINIMRSMDLATATGPDLQQHALKRGTPLRLATFANVSDAEQSLIFYVDTGTFGAINGGNDIVVPAGRTISSVPNRNEKGVTVDYQVTEEVVLSAADSVAFVSARALERGTGSNVGAGVLVQHNFTNYSDSLNSSLKVVNLYPILNGQDPEDEDVLKYRISKNYDRLMQDSETRLQLSALYVPGVVSVKTIPGYFGIGTVGVVVLGPENESNSSLVSQVQERVNMFKAPGLRAIAVPAVQVTLDIDFKIKLAKPITVNEENRIRREVRSIIKSYASSVGIGGTCSMTDLTNYVLHEVSQYVQLASKNKLQKYEKAYLRRGYSNGRSSERSKLIQDAFSLAEDEYLEVGELDIRFMS